MQQKTTHPRPDTLSLAIPFLNTEERREIFPHQSGGFSARRALLATALFLFSFQAVKAADNSNYGRPAVNTSVDTVSAPVSLTSFTGRRQDNGPVTLEWVTAREEGNARFEILRSEDGLHFEMIGEVMSMAPYGSSVSPVAYSFVDEKLLSGDAGPVEYQLKEINQAGEASFSEVVRVGKARKQIIIENGLSIFPNPGSSRFNVQISNVSEGSLLTVSGPSGDILYMHRFPSAVAGRYTSTIDLGDVPGGTYYVHFSSPSGYQENVKMLVQQQSGLASK